jgi:hypothetical protein
VNRQTFWPESETHLMPTEPVEDGTINSPPRWPWARDAAVRVLSAGERLPFVTRVVVDASRPFEVVCAIPKVSNDFEADVARVRALVDAVVRGTL